MFLDCMGPAEEGQTTNLKCTMDRKPRAKIFWIMPDKLRVVQCDYTLKQCYNHPSKPDPKQYEGVVLEDFQFLLVIHSFSPASDVGQWACTEGTSGIEFTCFKHLGSKFLSICMFVCLSLFVSLYLYIGLSVCLSIYIYLSVCVTVDLCWYVCT